MRSAVCSSSSSYASLSDAMATEICPAAWAIESRSCCAGVEGRVGHDRHLSPASAPARSSHLVDHRLGQAPGEGVLLARVVAADQHRARARQLGAVSEPRPRARQGGALRARHGCAARRPRRTRRGRGSRGPRGAAASRVSAQVRQWSRSRGVGPVGRRRAPDHGCDPDAVQAQPVIRPRGTRRAGEPRAPQRPVEEVAGAVAGEHPPGPVGAVRGGRQAEQQQARRRVAEARHRAGPSTPARRMRRGARGRPARATAPAAGSACRPDISAARLFRSDPLSELTTQ